MEYKIFNKIRNKIKIPYIFRLILWVILIIIWVISSLIPIIPWFILVITGILFLIPWKFIKKIIKIRKWFFYLIKNIGSFQIIRHKIFDIIKHIKDMFKRKK